MRLVPTTSGPDRIEPDPPAGPGAHPAGRGTPRAPAARPAVAQLPAYRPGRSVADAMAEHGITGGIKLASNELPWGPLPAVAAAIADAAGRPQLYPDHRATALRAELARRFGVGDDQVTVGCGAVGILAQLAMAFVDPGDEVVRGEPSFEAYPIFTRMVGGTDVAVPAVDHRLDLDAMGAAVGPRTRLVLVANPNNPTGTAVDHDGIVRLAATVAEQAGPDGLLVVDEAYQEFVTDPAARSALDLVGSHDNVVVLRTFSKAHGLAGLRIGYAIGHPAVIEALDKVLVPFSVSSVGQTAALASLAATEELDERVDRVVTERGRVVRELRRLGWDVPDAQANFVWLPVGAEAAGLASALEARGVVTRSFPGLGVRVTISSGADNDRFITLLPTPVLGA